MLPSRAMLSCATVHRSNGSTKYLINQASNPSWYCIPCAYIIPMYMFSFIPQGSVPEVSPLKPALAPEGLPADLGMELRADSLEGCNLFVFLFGARSGPSPPSPPPPPSPLHPLHRLHRLHPFHPFTPFTAFSAFTAFTTFTTFTTLTGGRRQAAGGRRPGVKLPCRCRPWRRHTAVPQPSPCRPPSS
jgi:hypothetical protein